MSIGERGVHTLLSARLLDLLCGSHPDQSVMWLELLHRLVRVVDEGETGALTAAVVCSESKDADLVFVGFVELGEFLSQFIFGAVGAAGVEDIPTQRERLVSRSPAGWAEEMPCDVGDGCPHTRPFVVD